MWMHPVIESATVTSLLLLSSVSWVKLYDVAVSLTY